MIRANLLTSAGIDISDYAVIAGDGTSSSSSSTISTPAQVDDLLIVSADGATTSISGVTTEVLESCTGTAGSVIIYKVTSAGSVTYQPTGGSGHMTIFICRKSS